MRENTRLLRPSDPNRRPRFDLPESERDLGASVIAHEPRSPKLLAAVLVTLMAATVGLLLAAALGAVTVWAPVAAAVALFAYMGALRATRESRMARSRNAHDTAALADASTDASESTLEGEAADESDAGQDTKAPSEAPAINHGERHETYLREVMNRHNANAGTAQAEREHSGSLRYRYGALSSQAIFESPVLEEMEAYEEAASSAGTARGQVIGHGLTVDEILERRRA